MGRNKIDIVRIPNDRSRLMTFEKRKTGVIKKAMELSILCDSRILLCVFSPNNSRVVSYATHDPAELFSEYMMLNDQNITPLTNEDYKSLCYNPDVLISAKTIRNQQFNGIFRNHTSEQNPEWKGKPEQKRPRSNDRAAKLKANASFGEISRNLRNIESNSSLSNSDNDILIDSFRHRTNKTKKKAKKDHFAQSPIKATSDIEEAHNVVSEQPQTDFAFTSHFLPIINQNIVPAKSIMSPPNPPLIPYPNLLQLVNNGDFLSKPNLNLNFPFNIAPYQTQSECEYEFQKPEWEQKVKCDFKHAFTPSAVDILLAPSSLSVLAAASELPERSHSSGLGPGMDINLDKNVNNHHNILGLGIENQQNTRNTPSGMLFRSFTPSPYLHRK